MALIQTPNFSYASPNAQIGLKYFATSSTEMTIFLLLNLVWLVLRSASESIQLD